MPRDRDGPQGACLAQLLEQVLPLLLLNDHLKGKDLLACLGTSKALAELVFRHASRTKLRLAPGSPTAGGLSSSSATAAGGVSSSSATAAGGAGSSSATAAGGASSSNRSAHVPMDVDQHLAGQPSSSSNRNAHACMEIAQQLAAQSSNVALRLLGNVISPAESLRQRITSLQLCGMRLFPKALSSGSQLHKLPRLHTLILHACHTAEGLMPHAAGAATQQVPAAGPPLTASIRTLHCIQCAHSSASLLRMVLSVVDPGQLQTLITDDIGLLTQLPALQEVQLLGRFGHVNVKGSAFLQLLSYPGLARVSLEAPLDLRVSYTDRPCTWASLKLTKGITVHNLAALPLTNIQSCTVTGELTGGYWDEFDDQLDDAITNAAACPHLAFQPTTSACLWSPPEPTFNLQVFKLPPPPGWAVLPGMGNVFAGMQPQNPFGPPQGPGMGNMFAGMPPPEAFQPPPFAWGAVPQPLPAAGAPMQLFLPPAWGPGPQQLPAVVFGQDFEPPQQLPAGAGAGAAPQQLPAGGLEQEDFQPPDAWAAPPQQLPAGAAAAPQQLPAGAPGQENFAPPLPAGAGAAPQQLPAGGPMQVVMQGPMQQLMQGPMQQLMQAAAHMQLPGGMPLPQAALMLQAQLAAGPPPQHLPPGGAPQPPMPGAAQGLHFAVPPPAVLQAQIAAVMHALFVAGPPPLHPPPDDDDPEPPMPAGPPPPFAAVMQGMFAPPPLPAALPPQLAAVMQGMFAPPPLPLPAAPPPQPAAPAPVQGMLAAMLPPQLAALVQNLVGAVGAAFQQLLPGAAQPQPAAPAPQPPPAAAQPPPQPPQLVPAPAGWPALPAMVPDWFDALLQQAEVEFVPIMGAMQPLPVGWTDEQAARLVSLAIRHLSGGALMIHHSRPLTPIMITTLAAAPPTLTTVGMPAWRTQHGEWELAQAEAGVLTQLPGHMAHVVLHALSRPMSTSEWLMGLRWYLLGVTRPLRLTLLQPAPWQADTQQAVREWLPTHASDKVQVQFQNLRMAEVN